MSALGAIGLLVIGFGASVFGSLVGLGGGFLAVPLLRLVYGVPPAQAAGTSLLLVLATTSSSTIGYLRQGRVDLRLAVPFAIGAVPMSILGVLAVKRFSPAGFDLAYGVLLVVLSFLVLRRRGIASRPEGERTFAHDPGIGIAAGAGIGFFSSLFGIGGGIVLVPLLLIAARMPPHVVTATSAFVITVTAPVGIAAHAVAGDVDWIFALPLAIGGLIGGTLGPPLAKRVSSPRLITLLAVGLILAAVGLVARHLR